MKKAYALFLSLCFIIIFTVPLSAQSEDDSDEDGTETEADWYGELPPLYSSGDKTFNISLGLIFPALFIENGKAIDLNMSVIGGSGCLVFNYFLDAHFFAGGEIGGQFNSTLARNTVFIIPIGIRGGYQFMAWKMEIPLTLTLGIAPQRFLAQEYLGFFLKGSASAYYRFNPDWSFGMDLSWSWFPQWTKDPSKNVNGSYVNMMFTARYHF